MHRNAFFWGVDVGDFLIQGLTVKTGGGLVGVCVFIGILAFAFEYLRYLQTKQRQTELKIRAKQLRLLCSTESSALLAETVTNPRNPLNITLLQRAVLFSTEVSLWWILQNMGYILMLGIMLFNGWFLFSAVIGGGIGYFVFGQKFMKINLQNCSIIRGAYCTQICGEADMKRDGESTPALERPSTSGSMDCHNNTSQPIQTSEISIHSECHN